MEDALREVTGINIEHKIVGLNPYCNGRCS